MPSVPSVSVGHHFMPHRGGGLTMSLSWKTAVTSREVTKPRGTLMKSRKRSDDRRTRRTACPDLEPMESRQLLSHMGLGHIRKPGHIQKPGHVEVFALPKSTQFVSP